MSKLTKKQKIIIEKVDPEKIYSLSDALEIMQSVKSEKFEESVDIAIRLGVDPNKSDQNVRGAVTLPNSLGKAVTVAVFADAGFNFLNSSNNADALALILSISNDTLPILP